MEKNNTLPMTQDNFDCVMVALTKLGLRVAELEKRFIEKEKQEPYSWQDKWYFHD